MVAAAQLSVFFGALMGVLHIFRIFPQQPNAKIWAYALFHVLTILLLLLALATGHFIGAGIGVAAFLAAAATLIVGALAYRAAASEAETLLIAAYLVLEMVTLVLIFGAAGLGLFQ